jgi:hypothetical protein
MFLLIQYKTDLVRILKVPRVTVQPNFVYIMPDDSGPTGRTVFLELTPPPEIHYKTRAGSSQQMNVLGIVIFSATMGKDSLSSIYLFFFLLFCINATVEVGSLHTP